MLDETDRLLNEAAAALDLELFAEPEDAPESEPEPEPEVTEPEPEPAAEEPEPEQHRPIRIDVVPIDEDTMDIRI